VAIFKPYGVWVLYTFRRNCHPLPPLFHRVQIYIYIIIIFFLYKGGGNLANQAKSLILYGLKIATPPFKGVAKGVANQGRGWQIRKQWISTHIK